ncbi:MAG TPA: ATP-binding protein [Phenylobacterium sp.]|nr:ATP-binding protein [Phenylobacterium sp.]
MVGLVPTRNTAEVDLVARLHELSRTGTHSRMLLDREGRIVWVNNGFERMTGLSAAQACGQTPPQLLQPPNADACARTDFTARIVEGQAFRLEIEIRGPDGASTWGDLHVRPLHGEDGGVEGFTGLLIESSETHRLQEQLKAAATSLSSAAELARLGGWEVDLRRNEVRLSLELNAILGRPRLVEPIDGALNLYVEDERERVGGLIGAAIATGERLEFEAKALTGDGQEIWLRVIGQPEMVGGRCVAMRGASQDITGLVQANADLKASERFARGVFDGISAFIMVIDADGVIVEANKAFRTAAADLAKVDAYPMRRNLFSILSTLPGRHGAALTKGIRAVLAGERPNFSRAYTSSSGEWFRCTASRFDGDGPVRCVVITQTIEDLKRQERRLMEMNQRLKRARDEANSASAAKSAFLATMSHEIRTPLNGVLGMAQAMARDELSPAQRERLGVVRQAGETLLTLLNDLLDLSRIESGRLELEDGVLDIRRFVAGAQATFTTLAADKDVSLTIEVAPEAEGQWRGDPTRVRQILYNLVSNAVKFTARGSVQVRVRREEPHLILEVADTGPGIPSDRMGLLFEKFVQVDTSTTRRYGGSGLGLSICRELTEMMGGDIEAQSQEGVGSVFTVRLPLERAPDSLLASQALADDATLSAAPAGLRILAAEDNPMNQLVLKTLLAQLDLEVTCVADGRQAVEAWASDAWDAVLMDVQMPVMDGPDATREIRRLERETGRARTPIIALTANAMAHHHEEYLSAGMDVLVPKPLQLERLLIAIQQVLEDEEATA